MMPPRHVIELAISAARMSPCQSKRGAVIYAFPTRSLGDVISYGYNHKPKGFTCSSDATCKATCRFDAVHAEQAALLTAGTKAKGAELVHVKAVDDKLVPSGDPSCVHCSKLVIEAGVEAVWLCHQSGWQRYRSADFHKLSLLNDAARRNAAV